MDALNIVRDLPYDVGIVLRQARKGRLKVEFEHVGLEPIRRTMDRLAHRIPLTILIAALLLSSSVLVLAQVPPFVGGIPLLAVIGYIITIILSSILVIYIMRRS
jgi:ubiquinone biosynthesis protein